MADERVAPDDDPADGTFLFHEQADGRKVARLPGGKVILLHRDDIDRVRGGEWWNVRLTHRDSRELAYVVDKPIFFLEEFRGELKRERKPAEDSSSPR